MFCRWVFVYLYKVDMQLLNPFTLIFYQNLVGICTPTVSKLKLFIKNKTIPRTISIYILYPQLSTNIRQFVFPRLFVDQRMLFKGVRGSYGRKRILSNLTLSQGKM